MIARLVKKTERKPLSSVNPGLLRHLGKRGKYYLTIDNPAETLVLVVCEIIQDDVFDARGGDGWYGKSVGAGSRLR